MDSRYLWAGIGGAIAIWIVLSLFFGANQPTKEIIVIDDNDTDVIIVTNETNATEFKHNFTEQTILDH